MDTTQLPLGLSLVRATEIFGAEPYFHDLVGGIEEVTLKRGYSVLLRVLATRDEEREQLKAWADNDAVSGVFVVDIEADDARPALLTELGLPAVIAGPPGDHNFMTVWTDDDAAMDLTVRFLAEQGHQNLLHVGGPMRMRHSEARREAFEHSCDELGLTHFGTVGDYSRESGRTAVLAQLTEHPEITAAIFDSDLMAFGGLDAAAELERTVPEELALIAWDDSTQAQLARPALTAIARDIRSVGRQIGQAMLDVLDGAEPEVRRASSAIVIERETTQPRESN